MRMWVVQVSIPAFRCSRVRIPDCQRTSANAAELHHVDVVGAHFGRRGTCIEVDSSRQPLGSWVAAQFGSLVRRVEAPMA